MLLGVELANCLRKAVSGTLGFQDAPDGLMDRTYGWIVHGTQATLSMLVLDDSKSQSSASRRYVSRRAWGRLQPGRRPMEAVYGATCY
jgi:hypothetical protein